MKLIFTNSQGKQIEYEASKSKVARLAQSLLKAEITEFFAKIRVDKNI